MWVVVRGGERTQSLFESELIFERVYAVLGAHVRDLLGSVKAPPQRGKLVWYGELVGRCQPLTDTQRLFHLS